MQCDLALEKGLNKYAATARNTQGVSFYFRGDYPNALEYFDLSMQINIKSEDIKNVANNLSNMGMVYKMQGNYLKAIDHFSRCLKIHQELEYKLGIAAALNNMGLLFEIQEDYAKALEYYTNSLEIKKEIGDKRGISGSITNIGSVLQKTGKVDKALDNYKQSLQIDKELEDKNGIAQDLSNIGLVYSSQGNTKLAKEFFVNSMEIYEEIGDRHGKANTLILLGNNSLKTGNYKNATSLGIEGLKLAKELGVVYTIKGASEILFQSYKALGENQKALEMYELFNHMNDSLVNEGNTRALIQQEYKYEYEKRAMADSIKNVEASKVKNALLLAERAENAKQRQQSYFLYAGLAIMVLFGGFIFNRLQFTRKQNSIIEKQKKAVEFQKSLVEEKNKDITDSIRYAENIQKALLPTIENLKEALPDGFILFQPKDIVSGDFYWMQHYNDRVYLAVCDCTGHGVPGAFMSMIGSSLLDEAVVEKGITKPNEIFFEVRKGFINALKQTGEAGQQKDGMDAVLVAWDKQSTLQVAAAYNSVLLIRNGEILETKADKQPVGFHTEEQKPFTHHEIKLEKGDTIYLFSDGYPDQFGGPKDKKFMMKNFKKLLLSIQDKTMNEQKEILETTMAEWKGDTEQVDDILVMGVRF